MQKEGRSRLAPLARRDQVVGRQTIRLPRPGGSLRPNGAGLPRKSAHRSISCQFTTLSVCAAMLCLHSSMCNASIGCSTS